MNGDEAFIRFRGVKKVYPLRGGDVTALDGIDLDIARGEFIAIMGPSGSGKSTLLNLLGCLDTPTAGELVIAGRAVGGLSDDELTDLRRDTIGFIFQQFNLLPLLDVVENVKFPMILRAGKKNGLTPRARSVIAAMQLDDSLLTHKPSELSGGQQQRVAIARALANDPGILLADEPTGNLDSRTGTGIMDLLAEMNRHGKTIIMVTHDPGVASYAKRIITLVDGRIQ